MVYIKSSYKLLMPVSLYSLHALSGAAVSDAAALNAPVLLQLWRSCSSFLFPLWELLHRDGMKLKKESSVLTQIRLWSGFSI